jgi:GNAT superfamily N-acetyltransferase
VAAIHGPLWLGYATEETFRRIDGRGSRRLDGPGHMLALAGLRRWVTREEWVDAGFEVPGRREYGCFVHSELVCAGTLMPFRGLPASIGVLTHPAHRGLGFGSAMVSALTAEALTKSRAAQFRTLEDNRPALRIARVLGYVEDGRTFEVALRPTADTNRG